MKHFNKDRLYLLGIIMSVLIAFTGIFSYYVYYRQKSHLITDYQTRIKSEIKLISNLLTKVLATNCFYPVKDLLTIWTNGHSDVVLLEVILDTGNVVFSYNANKLDKHQFLVVDKINCPMHTLNLAIAYDSQTLTFTLNELYQNFILLTTSLIICVGFSLWFLLFRWIIKPVRLEISHHTQILRDMVNYTEGLYNAMNAHAAVLDNTGTITSTNQAWQNFAQRNGFKDDPAMIGESYFTMAAALYRFSVPMHDWKQGVEEVILGLRLQYICEYGCKDQDQQCWFIMHILPVVGSNPAIIIATHEDVTRVKESQLALAASEKQLREINQALNILSITDKLTQLYNRAKLDEVLAEETKHAKLYAMTPLSIILTDIDHFKHVNDTYGHQAGDRTLVQFAKILKENIRNSDVVGRWGGEEFLIICLHTDSAGAKYLAEKIRKILSNSCIENIGTITASFGVAGFLFGDDSDSLLGRADQALYEAKNSGRNRVVIAE